MMRQRVVAGNWKLNTTRSEAVVLATEIADSSATHDVDVVLFPPHPWLEAVARATDGTAVRIGGQDCWHVQSGAFTGQVSPRMLRELCTHVIVGHSEHRRDAGESDRLVGEKAAAALDADLIPIVCVGESSEVRDSGEAEDFVGGQVESILAHLTTGKNQLLLIAYEPIWAIGSGQSASVEDAESMSAHIRERLASHGPAMADQTQILYGGSVSSDNAAAFVDQANVDGLLVGGASLDSSHFLRIVNSC